MDGDDLDELRPLEALSRLPQGVAAYYLPLTSDPDEAVRLGAWLALFNQQVVPPERFSEAEAMARYEGARRYAFNFFEMQFEHDISARVARMEPVTPGEPDVDAMVAEVSLDPAGAAAAKRRLFLKTGELDALRAETEFTYFCKGPRAALPLAVRNLVIDPHRPAGALTLLFYCRELRRTDLLDRALELLVENGVHLHTALVYTAASDLMKGNAAEALERLEHLSQFEPAPETASRMHSIAQQIVAEAREQLGDHRGAYEALVKMNDLPAELSSANLGLIRSTVAIANAREIPPLPRDEQTNWFIMLGFARSGTTLLENALASHPRVETFEERPIRPATRAYLDRALPTASSREAIAACYVEARRRYYLEMKRTASQSSKVYIDKNPMATTDAKFLSRLFPEKRYIFSIRHPFDVVLSCFRQTFVRNIAMDQFRTFASAVSYYDFTMSEWFDVFQMPDSRVHYLRYDDLVEDFDGSMRGVLNFIGVPWDDAVQKFADTAAQRAGTTPSYGKVRQGLSIGVQSSWRNYRFLFDSGIAEPLRKWVAHFGYAAD